MEATMTPILPNQMVVTFDDLSMMQSVKKAISLMRGVRLVSVPKQTKRRNTYYESKEFYADLDAAEKDIRAGKGVRINSAKELDALFL